MSCTVVNFGTTRNGQPVRCFRLENKNHMVVELIELGAAIRSIVVPTADGRMVDVAFGYDTVEEYEVGDVFIGAVVGRYGSRIRNGQFTLNGKQYQLYCNDQGNHLHGGQVGFGKRLWHGEKAEGKVVFSYLSPDGEDGYPGNLFASVAYTLTENNRLVLEYRIKSDADTMVNLTNHCYFNLNGHASGSVLTHTVQLDCDYYTPGDATLVPTGEIRSVKGTPLDFTSPKQIGRDIDQPFDQLQYGTGYDLNYVINGRPGTLRRAAKVWAESGITMQVYTTRPGMQFYSGNFLTGQHGKQGAVYARRSGLCMETQVFPNSMEYGHFPDPVVHTGEKLTHTTIYAFGNTAD